MQAVWRLTVLLMLTIGIHMDARLVVIATHCLLLLLLLGVLIDVHLLGCAGANQLRHPSLL